MRTEQTHALEMRTKHSGHTLMMRTEQTRHNLLMQAQQTNSDVTDEEGINETESGTVTEKYSRFIPLVFCVG